MTVVFTNPSTFLTSFYRILGQASLWAARALMGALLIVAAGTFAVATAFVGLLIAAAAVLMKLAGRMSSHNRRSSSEIYGGQPFIIEARRTPRGWTVE